MILPDWAIRAFGKIKPHPLSGTNEPDPQRLAWWHATMLRFETRWHDLETDKWRVPLEHPCYLQLRRALVPELEPVEFVRLCILETALGLSWDKMFGRSPDNVAQAVKALDSINDKIAQTADALGALFRQRDQLQLNYGVDDYTDDYGPDDAYNFWDAFEASMLLPHVQDWAYVAESEIRAFLVIARTQSRPRPQWPDLLDQVVARRPRAAAPNDAGDIAVRGSRTNATEWSRWGLKLLGTLDDWGGAFPRGFLRPCLTNGQLATLAALALDAPATAFNTEQMRKLATRYDDARNRRNAT